MKRMSAARAVVLAGVLSAPSGLRAQRTQTFNLVSVTGAALPAAVTENDAGRVDIIEGSLTLRSDGSYAQRETRRFFPSDEAARVLGQKARSNAYTREAGTYIVRDTLLILTPYADSVGWEVPYLGSIRGGAVLFSSDGNDYAYRKGGRIPASPPTALERKVRAESAKPASVMDRCLAAGRLQARAADENMARIHAMPGSDETSAPPSPDEAEARDANIISICTTMPGIYLPELR
ncbi:MAG TPA: hypothetical protein VII66_00310 [Gemmatimonadaceae bacterium]